MGAPRALVGLPLRACLILAGLAGLAAAESAGNSTRPVQAAASRAPRLLFADEFNGTALDRRKWEAQIGNGCQYNIPGWGNAERQWYTDLPGNLAVRRGNLVLRAVHDRDALAAMPPRQPFTSARVRTFQRFSVAPTAAYPTIRIEARIKTPKGLGLWPAFWLLPEDGSFASCSGCGRYGGWASSGEIDIMELANDATQLKGTIHYGGPWPANVYAGGSTTLPDNRSFSDGFHVYRLEWERSKMRWYVDGKLFHEASSGKGTKEGWYSLQPCSGEACASAPARPGNAPFDRKFHLILNLALGGEGTAFTQISPGVGVTEEQLKAALERPKAMLVDWVRVHGIPAGSP